MTSADGMRAWKTRRRSSRSRGVLPVTARSNSTRAVAPSATASARTRAAAKSSTATTAGSFVVLDEAARATNCLSSSAMTLGFRARNRAPSVGVFLSGQCRINREAHRENDGGMGGGISPTKYLTFGFLRRRGVSHFRNARRDASHATSSFATAVHARKNKTSGASALKAATRFPGMVVVSTTTPHRQNSYRSDRSGRSLPDLNLGSLRFNARRCRNVDSR